MEERGISHCLDHVAVKINFTVLFKGNGLKHIILYYMAGAMAHQANHLPSSTGIPCEYHFVSRLLHF